MRSRGRVLLEAGLRALALVALVLLIAHTHLARDATGSASAAGDGIDDALQRWSTRQAPASAHVAFDHAATPVQRDWLAALVGAGTPVTWNGAAPPAVAVAVEPVADPARTSRVWLAAGDSIRLQLRDALGPVDSLESTAEVQRLQVPQLTGTLRLEEGSDAGSRAGVIAASATQRDSLLLRPVLLLAQAGWEAKFTLAALEEQGWEVDARLALGPGGDVQQGAGRLVLDTATYAAVVAIDSVAVRYASRIADYVRQGGGLVASGEASRVAALAGILPARAVAPPTAPVPFEDAAARTALALSPLGDARHGALVLEVRGDDESVAAVAWRAGHGRVLQLGYHESWRWRMAGVEEDPVRAHREWWSAVVGSVAYAPRIDVAPPDATEPTPRASMVAALGMPAQGSVAPYGPLQDPRAAAVLLGIFLMALLLEWASRRLRGAR